MGNNRPFFIVKNLAHLPQPKLPEVLNLIKFLVWKKGRTNQLDSSEPGTEMGDRIGYNRRNLLSDDRYNHAPRKAQARPRQVKRRAT